MVDALVITHYHLDHVGALPHFVSVLGYRGPIFMTSATRGIAQTMLLDYVYVMRDRKQARPRPDLGQTSARPRPAPPKARPDLGLPRRCLLQVEFIYTKEDLLYALSRVTVIVLLPHHPRD